jgi:hypothetical protein
LGESSEDEDWGIDDADEEWAIEDSDEASISDAD